MNIKLCVDTFWKKEKAVQIKSLMKINNSKSDKVLLKTRDGVFDEYPNTREFIVTSKAAICRSKNASSHRVFSISFAFLCCCLYHNLWLTVVCYHYQKMKMMLLIIGLQHCKKSDKEKNERRHQGRTNKLLERMWWWIWC